MSTIIPPYLETGDIVLLIATARARSKEALQPSIDMLNSWGFNVECGPNLFKVHNQFAGTDEERAADLQWAIDHPLAKAVLLAGGGYGSLRIIDRVDFTKLHDHPKWLAGYSDATVIHSRLQKLGVTCIHGTMAFQFSNAEAVGSLQSLLHGKPVHYEITPHALNRTGRAAGEFIGGNLSLIYALSGSADELDTKNKVLFIEDLDEQLYHIDRMILQLKRAGKLKELAGLVVGGMTEMKDNSVPFGKSAEEIIREAVDEYDYPVVFNFPAGHIEKNMAIFLNRDALLDVQPEEISFRYI